MSICINSVKGNVKYLTQPLKAFKQRIVLSTQKAATTVLL
jgi:hypothetical protein